MPSKTDLYANIAAAIVTESGSNTLTFQEMLTGVGLGTGYGMLIDEIDYYFNAATLGLLIGDTDTISVGWTVSNSVPDLLDVTDRRILHQMSYMYTDLGTTPAAAQVYVKPSVFQFFPPLIVAAQRLFLACAGVSVAAAIVCRSRMYWRFVQLEERAYLEIAEANALLS